MASNSLVGLAHAIGIGAFEAVPAEEQKAGVDLRSAEDSRITFDRLIPCLRLDLDPDRLARRQQAIRLLGADMSLAVQLDEAVESGPTQKPRMSMVTASGARFPQTLVGLSPMSANIVAETA